MHSRPLKFTARDRNEQQYLHFRKSLPAEAQPLTAQEYPRAGFWGLTLGAIGVVYGDIGTSPLYALRKSVLAAVGPGAPASEAVVLGILSLIIWALVLVVTRQICA